MARFSINIERLRIYALTAPLSSIAPLVRAAKARCDKLGVPEDRLFGFSPLTGPAENPGMDHDAVRVWITEHDFVGDGEEVAVDEDGLNALINLASLSALTDPKKDMEAAALIAQLQAGGEDDDAEEPEPEAEEGDGEGEEEKADAEGAEKGTDAADVDADGDKGEGGDAEGQGDAEGDKSEDTAST